MFRDIKLFTVISGERGTDVLVRFIAPVGVVGQWFALKRGMAL